MKTVIQHSVLKGFQAAFSVLIIMIPISFFMTMLMYTGWLTPITGVLAPLMSVYDIPAEASMALIVGALLNIYACIAVMASMPLDMWSINIIAVMMLICHNLPIETAVQAQTGAPPAAMALFRIIAALATGLVLTFILPESLKMQPWVHASGLDPASNLSWRHILCVWTHDSLLLTLKVTLIILAITIFIDLMRHFNVLETLSALFKPFTFINALPTKATFMWMTGLFFGIAYGSGVLISEAKAGHLDRDTLLRLNISLGISHSLIEDTLLFVAIGASLLGVLIPRMIAAALCVWLFVALKALRNASS